MATFEVKKKLSILATEMDESMGAQYALQVALQTLKERCQQFQQRIATLEEENINLRLLNNKGEGKDSSLSEIDALKERVAKLTQQKAQLRNNLQMVSAENQQLWTRLIKITKAKETLGTQLSKINDTLTQHTLVTKHVNHSPVIRSKTFTIDEPQTKILQKNVPEEDSLCLEDISLKLINNLVKEKSELELQCTQMAEIQNSDINKNSFGFVYSEEDLEEVTLEEVEKIMNEMKEIRESLIQEREILRKNLLNLNKVEVTVSKCKFCENVSKETEFQSLTTEVTSKEENSEEAEIARQLESLTKWGTPENSASFVERKAVSAPPTKHFSRSSLFEADKICPMCSKIYPPFIDFQEFHSHVENHFVQDHPQDNFELL